ncbi:hypothetical protein ACQQ2N_00030 [Dokdonella sp. MW10]|uniref:hypothetical protein n=1 Tax=Dokdonella sp. MW10 TaxID=2992926 RepID=UPI003F813334
MRVFVPMEDVPFDAAMMAMLVPYQCGVVCEHALLERAEVAAKAVEGSAATRERRVETSVDTAEPHHALA